jgi:hypothetical protein
MTKDTLSLTNLQFKTVKKDRLYYDRFEYCLGFFLDEVSCLRVLDHDHIDLVIANRKQWREIAQQRWLNSRQKHGIGLSRQYRREITEKTVENLHGLATALINTDSEFKLVVSASQGYVYTNELSLIDQLDCRAELTNKTYTRAEICRPKNTIQLKNPRHTYRSYMQMTKLTGQQKQQLINFFHNQQDQVRLSPALKSWITQSFNRTQDYFFVDHDSLTWLTMLSLVQPGIVRKTMNIIPAK